MPNFQSRRNPDIVIVAKDRDELQMCPKCTFPNQGAAHVCVECGHPLQDGMGRWVPAKLIQRCRNSLCDAFVCTKDNKCKTCGCALSSSVEIEIPDDHSKNVLAECGDTFALVCPNCNMHNPSNVNKCEKCGYSLEDVDPIREAESDAIVLQLENLRTKKCVSLTLKSGDSVMIGRGGVLADQLVSTNYVSDKHMYLTYMDGTVWIRDGSRNGTYIDGSNYSLDEGIDTPLLSNTIVGLGDSRVTTLGAAFFKIIF